MVTSQLEAVRKKGEADKEAEYKVRSRMVAIQEGLHDTITSQREECEDAHAAAAADRNLAEKAVERWHAASEDARLEYYVHEAALTTELDDVQRVRHSHSHSQ